MLTITDNDVAPGTLQLSAAAYNVSENDGTATITITRTGGSGGAVGVTLSTSNGTATAPADYAAVTQTVTFADGDTANKTVTIPIVDDDLVESKETLTVTLSAPTGGATLGTPSTAAITIRAGRLNQPNVLGHSASELNVPAKARASLHASGSVSRRAHTDHASGGGLSAGARARGTRATWPASESPRMIYGIEGWFAQPKLALNRESDDGLPAGVVQGDDARLRQGCGGQPSLGTDVGWRALQDSNLRPPGS